MFYLARQKLVPQNIQSNFCESKEHDLSRQKRLPSDEKPDAIDVDVREKGAPKREPEDESREPEDVSGGYINTFQFGEGELPLRYKSTRHFPTRHRSDHGVN